MRPMTAAPSTCITMRAQLLSEIALVRRRPAGLQCRGPDHVDDASRAMLADLAVDLNGSPARPHIAAAMGATSINEVFHALPNRRRPASNGSALHPPIKGDPCCSRRAGRTLRRLPTEPVAREGIWPGPGKSPKRGNPAAPTERLRLGPDGMPPL